MTENDLQLEEMCTEKCVWQQDRKLDLSHLFLPSRREEGSSVISIFFLLLHFHLNLIVGVFWFLVFFVLYPEDLRRMPSNTVATAFKGPDYTDSPGSRMVRQMWGEPASGISVYETAGF